jgi:Arc/MetJ-type ribon-helix-helix transcriptional regulator
MAEKVVSVKMPASLVKELRALTAAHHYIDLSEQLRSVVRQQCLALTQDEQHGKQDAVLHDIENTIKQSTEARKQQLLHELQRLLEGSR